MIYQYVVWDWNGTLLDDMQAAYDAVSISLRKRGMRVPDRKFYADNFSFPVREYYKKLGFDFAVDSYEDLAVEFFENYVKIKTDLRLHAKKVLEKLFLNSVKQYILSASEKQMLLDGLQTHKVAVYFNEVIALSNTEADSKIAAGKAFFAAHRPEGKGIMIGDTVHDAETAKDYVEKIMPDIVIPMHYKTEDCTIDIEELDAFLDLFDEEDITYIEGDSLDLDRTQFDGDYSTKVIVFRR